MQKSERSFYSFFDSALPKSAIRNLMQWNMQSLEEVQGRAERRCGGALGQRAQSDGILVVLRCLFDTVPRQLLLPWWRAES